MNINISPVWISSSLLFVIGALLIVIGVLVLLLIESKKARAQLAATLNTSVARQNARIKEHRAEIEAIDKQYLGKMAAASKDHHHEMENLRVILSIADQDLHEALKANSKGYTVDIHMQSQNDHTTALITSCAAGNDLRANVVCPSIRAHHSQKSAL